MTYKEIMSKAISHHTGISGDYVENHWVKHYDTHGYAGKMLKSMMRIEFPEKEGQILLDDLKQKKLSEVMHYFINSFKVLGKEIKRQSVVN